MHVTGSRKEMNGPRALKICWAVDLMGEVDGGGGRTAAEDGCACADAFWSSVGVRIDTILILAML